MCNLKIFLHIFIILEDFSMGKVFGCFDLKKIYLFVLFIKILF